VIDLVRVAEQPKRKPTLNVAPARTVGAAENGEFVAVSLLLQRWDGIAPWLTEELFAADVHRRAFAAVAAAEGVLDAALELADPEAREILERAAVADLDADPEIEAFNLIAAAVRRKLGTRLRITDHDEIRADSEARKQLDNLSVRGLEQDAAVALLRWLELRTEEHGTL